MTRKYKHPRKAIANMRRAQKLAWRRRRNGATPRNAAEKKFAARGQIIREAVKMLAAFLDRAKHQEMGYVETLLALQWYRLGWEDGNYAKK